MSHGIAAMAFALSFFLEAYGIHLPLISIKAQHPSLMLDGFAFTGLLFAGAGTLTFACYEIFLIPEFLKTLEIGSSLRKRAKSIFIIYHVEWCVVVTILVLLPSASPAATSKLNGPGFWRCQSLAAKRRESPASATGSANSSGVPLNITGPA